jgi:DUF4097 and DUF4098 domain-containing protein YvlB
MGIELKTAHGRAPEHGYSRAVAHIFLAAIALSVAACGSDDGDSSTKVNGSIHVAAGQQPGAVTTVNGSIQIDDGATVTSATTVNGSVRLGDHTSATSLNSVNGSITLGSDAHVSGGVSSVNGALTLKQGSEVAGTLSNVNGKISLADAHAAAGIKTVNGSIDILGASHVEGGIRIEKGGSGLLNFGNNVPRIVIGPGATVQGDLKFERNVQLYVSDKATIGNVTGATPIPFSGDAPPN